MVGMRIFWGRGLGLNDFIHEIIPGLTCIAYAAEDIPDLWIIIIDRFLIFA
jgi:hypothetical protein